MSETVRIGCSCGTTQLEVTGAPILVPECMCESCRAAAGRLAVLPGAPNILTAHGGTPTAEYRKDRVRVVSGSGELREFRLAAGGSRRIVAACCNTPLFLEMKGAHWLSVYLHLWPNAARPKITMRTMVSDLADPSVLPDDIPNRKHQTIGFYAKLLGAWAAMGFRNPKVEVAGTIEA